MIWRAILTITPAPPPSTSTATAGSTSWARKPSAIFITTTGTRPSPLFRNTSNPANNYLEIMIDASAEQNVNRQGLGSQVFIYEAGHVGDPAFMLGMQEIEVSNGYSSGTEPIAHFGLGANTAVDVRVVLPWNAGTWTSLNVQANQRLTLGTPAAPYDVLTFDAKGRLQFTDADGDTIQM